MVSGWDLQGWGAAEGVQSPLPLSALNKQGSFQLCPLCACHAREEGPHWIFLQVSSCPLFQVKSFIIPWRERPQILLAQFHYTEEELKLERPFPCTAA